MKRILTFLCALCLTGTLFAQTFDTPVVFSVVGDAHYLPVADEPRDLFPGQLITTKGALHLREETVVGVYLNDAYVYLYGPKTYDLDAIVQDDNQFDSDAMAFFGLKLKEMMDPFFFRTSLGTAGGPIKPKKPKTSQTGTGNKNQKLRVISPLPGKLSAERVAFRWAPKKGVAVEDNYTLRIYTADGSIKYDKTIPDTRTLVSFLDLELPEGVTYFWEATSTTDPGVATGKIKMEIQSREELEDVLMVVRLDPAYDEASPAARLLMEASVLQQKGYPAQADGILRMARATFPTDPLLAAMHRYFQYLAE